MVLSKSKSLLAFIALATTLLLVIYWMSATTTNSKWVIVKLLHEFKVIGNEMAVPGNIERLLQINRARNLQPSARMGVNVLHALNNNIVGRLVRYEVKSDYQSAFRNALGDYVFFSLSKKSNILSEAFYEQENPHVLWIIERWSNKNELDKVGKSAQLKTIEALSEKALVSSPKTIYTKDLEPITRQQWRRTANREDQPLTIMLFVDSRPGTESTFKEVYHIAMPQFRGEPGVINYQLSQIEGDSTQFVTYEKFRNEDAFQYHLTFPPIKPVIDYLNTSIKKQPFQDGLHRLIEIAPHAVDKN